MTKDTITLTFLISLGTLVLAEVIHALFIMKMRGNTFMRKSLIWLIVIMITLGIVGLLIAVGGFIYRVYQLI